MGATTWNYKNSGHINPRKLVAAQQKIAKSRGCEIINDVVVTIKDSKDRDGGLAQLRCESGRMVQARKVLLCTGAFTNYHDLLPEDKKIDFKPLQDLCGVRGSERRRCQENGEYALHPVQCAGKKSYTLPPIKYPDGKSVLAQKLFVVF